MEEKKDKKINDIMCAELIICTWDVPQCNLHDKPCNYLGKFNKCSDFNNGEYNAEN